LLLLLLLVTQLHAVVDLQLLQDKCCQLLHCCQLMDAVQLLLISFLLALLSHLRLLQLLCQAVNLGT
jgi:hypothetical protein